MEVMELNEMKMDGADAATIRQSAAAILQALKAEVEPLLQHYDDATATEVQLAAIKAYYYKKKYIDRLLAE
jgi:molecular chaperone HscB